MTNVQLWTFPASTAITAGTETIVATLNNILLNAPQGGVAGGTTGLFFDGYINGATQATTTGITVNLRRGTTLTGTLVDSNVLTTSNLNATQSAMANWLASIFLADYSPPNNGAVTLGGGALPAALSVGVQGLPVTGTSYVLTITPAGGTYTLNHGDTSIQYASVAQ